MNKYYVVQRDFGSPDISVFEIKAPNKNEAWEIVEKEISRTMSQEWLFDAQEYNDFKAQLSKVNP